MTNYSFVCNKGDQQWGVQRPHGKDMLRKFGQDQVGGLVPKGQTFEEETEAIKTDEKLNYGIDNNIKSKIKNSPKYLLILSILSIIFT